MIITGEITRPALRYYGGKWNLAPWIISHFPEHKSYIEPCGGAASVLLQKPRSSLETYNDLYGQVTNFFKVLRDYPQDLIRKIRLTPYSRIEYQLSQQENVCPANDALEAARQFWVGSCFSISGVAFSRSGMRMVKNIDASPNGLRSWLYADVSYLESVANRLLGVQIENVSYQDAIRKYDHKEALIYFDPPYIPDTRTSKREYAIEWEHDDHREAASLLRQTKGSVIISGYASPLYVELYECHGWQRVEKESQTNSGGKRVECLWLCPRTQFKLRLPKQLSLI